MSIVSFDTRGSIAYKFHWQLLYGVSTGSVQYLQASYNFNISISLSLKTVEEEAQLTYILSFTLESSPAINTNFSILLVLLIFYV